jgi:hypothetical protein
MPTDITRLQLFESEFFDFQWFSLICFLDWSLCFSEMVREFKLIVDRPTKLIVILIVKLIVSNWLQKVFATKRYPFTWIMCECL